MNPLGQFGSKIPSMAAGIASQKRPSSASQKRPSSGGSYGGGSSGGASSSVSASGSAQVSAPQIPNYQSQVLAQLKAAQEAEQRARDEAYNRAAAAQKSAYDNNVNQLNGATNAALREAYINRMLSQRNLQQQLSAQGISGGASETTQASMLNNYEDSRNELEKERQRQLADLMQVYQNNMAALEQQRASGQSASLGQYQLALANLAANNGVDLLSMMQGTTASGQTTPSAHYVNGEWVYY